MLVPNKMQHVICTGNVGREQYEELRALAPNVHVVEGDFPEEEGNELHFPEMSTAQVGNFRIGVIHGHQLLPFQSQDVIARMRRKLNVDIMITGHSHQNEVVMHDGCFHINPVRWYRYMNTSISIGFSPAVSLDLTSVPFFLLVWLCFHFGAPRQWNAGLHYRSVFESYEKRHSVLYFIGNSRKQTCLLCL